MSFFNCLLHHQGEDAEIAIPLPVGVPVVAVQPGAVEVAEVEAVAVRVAGYARNRLNHCPLNTLRAV